MRVTDLPEEILELLFAQCTVSALGRVVATRTALSRVAGRVAARKVASDPFLSRNLWQLWDDARDEGRCRECLVAPPPAGAHPRCTTEGGSLIFLCALCTKEPGGYREIVRKKPAEELVKRALQRANQRHGRGYVEAVMRQCVVCTYPYSFWARELDRKLERRLKSLTSPQWRDWF